jgi:hypothetical protein
MGAGGLTISIRHRRFPRSPLTRAERHELLEQLIVCRELGTSSRPPQEWQTLGQECYGRMSYAESLRTATGQRQPSAPPTLTCLPAIHTFEPYRSRGRRSAWR